MAGDRAGGSGWPAGIAGGEGPVGEGVEGVEIYLGMVLDGPEMAGGGGAAVDHGRGRH